MAASSTLQRVVGPHGLTPVRYAVSLRQFGARRAVAAPRASYRLDNDGLDGPRKREVLHDNVDLDDDAQAYPSSARGSTSTLAGSARRASDAAGEPDGRWGGARGEGSGAVWEPPPAAPFDPDDYELGPKRPAPGAGPGQQPAGIEAPGDQPTGGGTSGGGASADEWGDLSEAEWWDWDRANGSAQGAGGDGRERDAAGGGGYGGVADEEERGGSWGRGQPDIVQLTEEEEAAILPNIPLVEQARYFSGGDVTTLMQRLGGALVVTVLAAKYALLAAGALTSPFWLPWAQAYARNVKLRLQYDAVGLWRARVVAVEFIELPRARADGLRAGGASGREREGRGLSTRLLVGDDSGARTEVVVDYSSRHEDIREGEPAELVVLGQGSGFRRFKALKEAYLPESGLWVSDYPYLNRDEFLRTSLDIERERRMEVGESWG